VRRPENEAHAVILAGGRGTRFWPRSRIRTPKQLLNIVGRETMLRQTIERLRPLFPPSRIWVVTNAEQAEAVRAQLPSLPQAQILSEPVGRNTAAAIGLAAIHIQHKHRHALMAVLPADHFIAQAASYRRIVQVALEVARRGPHLVVLGIPPTRPETGYGYIERGKLAARIRRIPVFTVRRFTEKPKLARARQYLAARRYFWNAGMFFWSVTTFLECLRTFLPRTHRELLRLAEDIGTRRYPRSLRQIYPRLENISVDYALMEPASRSVRGSTFKVFVLPASIGWSDIGSWASVYELQSRAAGDNVAAGRMISLDAGGNLLWSPNKLIAVIGVDNLVVVDTPDALLICSRDRAQDVGQIVKELERRNRPDLL
jgi:mannose-1-phosphate guanylyltransferase